MERTKFCVTCKWFNKLNAEDGECRKHAPRNLGEGKNCFPRVSHKTWCGEYKAAGEEVQTKKEAN